MSLSSVSNTASAQLSVLSSLRSQWQAQVDSAKFAPGANTKGFATPLPLFALPAWFGAVTDAAPEPVKADATLAAERFRQAAQVTVAARPSAGLFA